MTNAFVHRPPSIGDRIIFAFYSPLVKACPHYALRETEEHGLSQRRGGGH